MHGCRLNCVGSLKVLNNVTLWAPNLSLFLFSSSDAFYPFLHRYPMNRDHEVDWSKVKIILAISCKKITKEGTYWKIPVGKADAFLKRVLKVLKTEQKLTRTNSVQGLSWMTIPNTTCTNSNNTIFYQSTYLHTFFPRSQTALFFPYQIIKIQQSHWCNHFLASRSSTK